MRKLFYLKALMLSLCMAVSFVLPVNAQRNDNFWVNEENDVFRDSAITWTITNQNFQDAPIGSGLLILAVAGAGYAVARRKRNNKKGTALFLAFAMLLGLTQCKKNVETIANNGDGMTNITLRVANDSKHGVNPSNGQVLFVEDDIIYVAKSGEEAYLGYLTCGADGETFSGTISTSNIKTGDDLYFYFVGNLTPEGNLIADVSEEFNVYISNQASNLPVLSQGHIEYVSGTTSYECELKNKCSLVKFHLPEETSEPVYLCDMNQKVRVNMNGRTITYKSGNTGEITLFRNNMDDTEKCAILLPTAAESEVTLRVGSQYYTATLPALTENYFYTVDATSVTPVVTTPYFSVSATKKVLFAPGNLQYNDNGFTQWRFASHQYDYYTVWNGYDGWIDLFGWGTWKDNINTCNTSTNNASYTWTGSSTWTGVCPGTIEGHNDWYALTSAEWNYLLNSRTDAASKRGIATLTTPNVKGLVILTDDQDASDLKSSYNEEQWADMETKGAVFLPLAGRRTGTTIQPTYYSYFLEGNYLHGYYWSSTEDGNDPYSSGAVVIKDGENSISISFNEKYWGYSVRLVRNVTPFSK